MTGNERACLKSPEETAFVLMQILCKQTQTDTKTRINHFNTGIVWLHCASFKAL